MKLSKIPYRRLLPITVLSAVLGVYSLKIVEIPEDRKTRSIIAKQRDSIKALQKEFDECTNEKARREDCSVARPAEVAAPAPSPTARPKDRPVDKKCSDAQADRFPADMDGCLLSLDTAIHIRDARKEITCKTARLIHSVINMGMVRCDAAIDEAPDPAAKKAAEDVRTKLKVLHKDPRISPGPCRINENNR